MSPPKLLESHSDTLLHMSLCGVRRAPVVSQKEAGRVGSSMGEKGETWLWAHLLVWKENSDPTEGTLDSCNECLSLQHPQRYPFFVWIAGWPMYPPPCL